MSTRQGLPTGTSDRIDDLIDLLTRARDTAKHDDSQSVGDDVAGLVEDAMRNINRLDIDLEDYRRLGYTQAW